MLGELIIVWLAQTKCAVANWSVATHLICLSCLCHCVMVAILVNVQQVLSSMTSDSVSCFVAGFDRIHMLLSRHTCFSM